MSPSGQEGRCETDEAENPSVFSSEGAGVFKENDMTTSQIADAIAAFARNLDNSISMEDRRDSVQYLADRLGSDAANQIANIFGLKDDYYKA